LARDCAPDVYALDGDDRRVLSLEGNVVAEQDDVWTVVAVAVDENEAASQEVLV
jgi:hypothetical protein